MESSSELCDNYDHLDDHLDYILENVLSETVVQNASVSVDAFKLKEQFNTLLLNRCDCNNNMGEKEQCVKCCHGGNYVFDNDFKELVLNTVEDVGRDLIYECTGLCGCSPEKCFNRLVQRGPRKFLQIIDSLQYQSKGLKTNRNIPKGAFICEYAGELLTLQESKKILKENDEKHKMNYVLVLKESCKRSEGDIGNEVIFTIVDPSKKGNIGRYLNHSCSSNCKIISVRVDCPIPKIGKYMIESLLIKT